MRKSGQSKNNPNIDAKISSARFAKRVCQGRVFGRRNGVVFEIVFVSIIQEGGWRTGSGC